MELSLTQFHYYVLRPPDCLLFFIVFFVFVFFCNNFLSFLHHSKSLLTSFHCTNLPKNILDVNIFSVYCFLFLKEKWHDHV